MPDDCHWTRRKRLPLWFTALIAPVAICLPAAVCFGVVVLPKGSTQPVMGFLVRQDAAAVVVRQQLPGGKSRELRFLPKEIDELIITVDPQRLAALDPDRPELYREYAEELAEKQRDPEARETALRLYAIAAARGSGSLRRGALLGLVSLARTPAEERKFRAAAFLHDPDHDPSVLTEVAAARSGGSDAQARSELLAALRLIRQGKLAAAKSLLDRPAVQAELEPHAALVTPAQLAEFCAARQLTGAQLYRLLQAELALEGAPAGRGVAADAAGSKSAGWSHAASAGALGPLPSLSLDRLTEFDPADCVFRGGQWVRR